MVKPRSLLCAPLAALALAGCDVSPGIESEGGTSVACALGGASDFASECRLFQRGEGTGAVYVMRHPDGGFRTLVPADTPAGLAESDGSQIATSKREGGDIVLMIGDDRYRWKDPADE